MKLNSGNCDCPVGYYSTGIKCKICDPLCKTCDGGN